MKIGLIDVDGHNYPNLALMKISAYHKSKGDSVEWADLFTHYDRVYQTKVFSDTYSQDLEYIPNADEIIKGGTGYAITIENGIEVYHKEKDKPLPYEIEHQYPDYSIYPEFTKDKAYGFLTRGCTNSCDFCIVSKKEGRCSLKVADLNEFWRGQKKIVLCDPNILACKERKELLQQLIDSNAWVEFNQGLDARFITDEIAEMICKIKIDTVHFAFDFMKNEKSIINGLKIFKKHFNRNDRALKCYVLTNFNTSHQEDWYRVKKLRQLGFQPYVMIYQKGTHDKFLTDLQRWCNSSFLFRSCEFEDYIPRKDGKTCGEIYKEFINLKSSI